METIILASGSAQRREYFRLLGLPFRVVSPGLDETIEDGVEPGKAAEGLALQKVLAVRKHFAPEKTPWIAGADTVIVLDGKIFGKPKDRDHARLMLLSLRGRVHEVITAAALFNPQKNTLDCRSVTSTVSFADPREGEIQWYLDSGEWEGAAGAYRIQGLGACFIMELRGSFSSVAGLPLREFYVMLRANGYPYGEPAAPEKPNFGFD